MHNYPQNLVQLFSMEALAYHYSELKNQYDQSISRTRNKSISLPNITKTVSNINSYIVAIRLFKKLPNVLKYIKDKTNIYLVA